MTATAFHAKVHPTQDWCARNPGPRPLLSCQASTFHGPSQDLFGVEHSERSFLHRLVSVIVLKDTPSMLVVARDQE